MGCGASADAKKAGKGASSAAGGASGASTKDKKPSGGKIKVDNPGKVTDFYDLEKKKLGEGSYGAVTIGKNKSTGVVRAVKAISTKETKNLARFQQEIDIMKTMDHPNICKLFESFQDNRNVYLVLELCTGGELFDRIIECGHFTEVQAAIVMQHMFRAIYYMHEMHVCHRDLKPENFLFTTKDPIETTTLKVIDFGLARHFTQGQLLTTKAGTPYYVAPQVLQGKYDQSADLWSLGVIMYVVLCGYPPFYGDNDGEVLTKVKLGNFSFNAQDWKNVSDDAKQLIRMLLKMNPRDRYTAEQALNHVWVKNKAPKANDVPLQANMVDKLRGFRSQNKIKKAALHVIANQMAEAQIKELRDIFMTLDQNGDGLLTVAEMREGLTKAMKEIPPDLQDIMEGVDADGSGVIDYTEFLAATLDKKAYVQEDAVWQAFRVFDKNGDGKISKEELACVLKDTNVQCQFAKDMAEMMMEIDKNGDGEIDFDEFMAMMRS
jgi:calcium-dependent protein kinase